jgi:hypothetical protein
MAGSSQKFNQGGDDGDGSHHHAAELDGHALLHLEHVAAKQVHLAGQVGFGGKLLKVDCKDFRQGFRFRLGLPFGHARVFHALGESQRVECDGCHGVPLGALLFM